MPSFRPRFDSLMGISSRTAKGAAIFSSGVLIAHWAVIVAFILPRLDTLGFVRLHYTARFGVDWVGEWWKLFTFPLVGTIVLLVNSVLSGMLIKRTPRADIVIHLASAVVQAMLATAGIMALLLNS